MSSVNPFAPPGAEVADPVSTEFQRVRLWPASGRIGRLRFLAYSVGVWALTTLASMLIGAVMGALGSGLYLLPLLSTVIYFVASVLLLIQRSHDMDLSGWFSLLALIPLVGLFWVFKGGSRGVNRFGAPPPPNTLAVKIIACVFPAIFVIGILAAVALPAYQQYTLKARAAQSR
jgi:uncharacterized membrane protein YhaH (DUF805 family)